MDAEDRVNAVIKRSQRRNIKTGAIVFVIGVAVGVSGMLLSQMVHENRVMHAQLDKYMKEMRPASYNRNDLTLPPSAPF